MEIGTAFALPVEHLKILRHAIGYDDDGNDRYRGATAEARRNHFVTHPQAPDWTTCKALVALGYMADHGPRIILDGDHLFSVTDEGREVVMLHKPSRKKLTASQRRYQQFLDADCGMSFKQWLKGA